MVVETLILVLFDGNILVFTTFDILPGRLIILLSFLHRRMSLILA